MKKILIKTLQQILPTREWVFSNGEWMVLFLLLLVVFLMIRYL